MIKKEIISKTSEFGTFQSVVFVDSVAEGEMLFESLSSLNEDFKADNLVSFIEEGMGLDERAAVMTEFRY